MSDLLAAAGISPDLPAAEQAAAAVRALPLRYAVGSSRRDLHTAIESRWLEGPAECVRLLGQLYHGSARRGTAFGGSWPYLEAGGRIVAPAVPVVVGSQEAAGPDGAYELRDGVVWREAVGEVRPVLVTSGDEVASERAFDLLWFGADERYLVRDGILEVEDLFSVLKVPASPVLLDRLLVRARRVDREVLVGVHLSTRQTPAEIEVRRGAELVAGDGWRDPTAVLAARADLRRVERRADQVVAETVAGARVVFNVVEQAAAWKVFTWEGSYPFRTIGLTGEGGVLRLSAALSPDIDPFRAGVRGRLVFDLHADLIALGEG